MKKIGIILGLLLILFMPLFVKADTWEFKIPIIVTDTSGTTRTYYPVVIPTGVDDLSSYTTTGLDTNLQSAGANQKYLFTNDKLLTVVPSLPGSGRVTDDLYTGYSPNQTGFPIIVGDSGYVTIADNLTEPSGNSSQEISSFIINSGAFAEKDGAIKYSYDPATQNITAGFPVDYFASDYFTDVGAKIVVNNQRIEYESEASATDTRTWRDLGASVSDTYWHMSYAWYNTSGAGANRNFIFGLWSDNSTNFLTYVGDAIMVYIVNQSAYINRIDGGAGAASTANITFVNGTYYYVAFARETSTNVTLSIYTDVAMTTHLAGSPISFAIPATVTGLRYIQGSNTNSGAGAAIEQIGFIDNLFCTGLPIQGATKTGITAGEHLVTGTDNASSFGLSVDGSAFTTSNSTIIPNNSATWIFSNMPYTDNISLSVGGNRQVYLARPTSFIQGTNWADSEATGGTNNGVITWGNNQNITLSYGSVVYNGNTSASESGAEAVNADEMPMPSRWFGAYQLTPAQADASFAGVLFYETIHQQYIDGGFPTLTVYTWIFIALSLLIFLLVAVKSKSIAAALGGAIIVLFFGSQVGTAGAIPMWLPAIGLIMELALIFTYRQVA